MVNRFSTAKVTLLLGGFFFGVAGGGSYTGFQEARSTSSKASGSFPLGPQGSIIFLGALRCIDSESVAPSVSMRGDAPDCGPPAVAAGFVNENGEALSSVVFGLFQLSVI